MKGSLATLGDHGQRILLVDLTEGEPSDFAAPGERARQAAEADRILGIERLALGRQDRLLVDDLPLRLEVTALIREHQPRNVYVICVARVHAGHLAAVIARAAVSLASSDAGTRCRAASALPVRSPERWIAASVALAASANRRPISRPQTCGGSGAAGAAPHGRHLGSRNRLVARAPSAG